MAEGEGGERGGRELWSGDWSAEECGRIETGRWSGEREAVMARGKDPRWQSFPCSCSCGETDWELKRAAVAVKWPFIWLRLTLGVLPKRSD